MLYFLKSLARRLSRMPEIQSPPFSDVALIGAGLIGGSWALAIRAAYPQVRIRVFDLNAQHRIDAIARGIADEVFGTLEGAVKEADLVILAVPVGALSSTFLKLCPLIGPETVVTDVGSTKQGVIEAARVNLAEAYSRFVPGHPISGAEKSGPIAARGDLFQGKRTVLTPVKETNHEALSKVSLLWEKSGAEVHILNAALHDEVFAAVSHLPHLLSYALVDELATRTNSDLFFSYAAGGFRDFTRIAGSHPTMWRDISLANSPALLKELDAYSLKLQELRAALAKQDGAALLDMFERAQKARTDWANRLN